MMVTPALPSLQLQSLMSKGRSFIPDLDALESPLLSPTFVSGLGAVPGSAIAEKIFNDPDSWDETSGDEGDYPEDIEGDTLLWFAEEIEKLRVQSVGGVKDLSRGERRDSKDPDLVSKREGNPRWKDIARRNTVRPISLAGLFEQSNDDFSNEIQQHLSKILDTGKYHIGPRSSLLTPGSLNTPSTADSISPPLTSSSLDGRSPSIYTTSATLNFLEYYGIYPDSPRVDGRRLSRKRTPRRSKDSPAVFRPSLSHVPSTETTLPRLSSVPPPDLESPLQHPSDWPAPPGLTPSSSHEERSPSHNNNSDQEGSVSESESTSQRSRPLPVATAQAASVSADTAFRVRRLPSIPSDQQRVSRCTTPPPQSGVPTSAAFLSPSKSSAALSSYYSFGSASSSQGSMGLRTPLTARSPLGVPLGPRTRSRSGDAGRQIQPAEPASRIVFGS